MSECSLCHGQNPIRDRRGVTPAVAKSLELGITVLFVALVTTVSLAGVVPEYRQATDARVGDRVLAAASGEIATGLPPATRSVTSRYRVDVPATIGGQGYALRVDGRDLVLDHPEPAVAGRLRLGMPARVTRVEGRWDSGAETFVVVTGDQDGLVVTLQDGGVS